MIRRSDLYRISKTLKNPAMHQSRPNQSFRLPTGKFAYIDSKQSIKNFLFKNSLREDIADFQPSFDNEDFCPFCEKDHFQYKEIKSTGILENSNPSFSSFFICYHCSELKNTIEWDNLGEVMSYKLRKYIYEDSLAEGLAWAKSSSNYSTCFFCRSDIQQPVKLKERLLVPVGVVDPGAEVYACESCCSRYAANNIKHYKHTDTCLKCKKVYPLEPDTYMDRNETKTFGKCLCPTCYHGMYTIHNTKDPFKCLIHAPCTDCGITRAIDRREHSTIITDAIKIQCEDCQVKNAFIHTEFRGSPLVHWAGILKNEALGRFTFEVYRSNSKGSYSDSVLIFKPNEEWKYQDSWGAAMDMVKSLNAIHEPLFNNDEWIGVYKERVKT